MKKIALSTIVSIVLVSSVNAEVELQLHEGWQLLGSSTPITLDKFNKAGIQIVWRYDQTKQTWEAFSPDSSIQNTINNDSKIGSITNGIKAFDGFWVLVNAGYTPTLTLDTNLSNTNTTDGNDTVPVYNDNLSIRYADTLQDLTLSDIAGKTFKFPENNYDDSNDATITYDTITFDANGVYEEDNNETICTYDENGNPSPKNISEHLEVKIEDGSLNFYLNGTLAKSFKILAKDDTGIVFGAIFKNDSMVSIDPHDSPIPEDIFFVLNEGVSATPVDMGTLNYPVNVYSSWDGNYYETYETNQTISRYTYNTSTNSWEIDRYNSGKSYNIENGKLVEHFGNTWENGGYDESSSTQIIYHIGRYNVDQINYAGSSWDSVVKYKTDDNDTYQDLNLTANPNIDTWQKFFAATNGYYNDEKFYDENKTTSYGNSYSISSDGTVLTISSVDNCYGDDYSWSQTIQSGKITSSFQDVGLRLNSTSAILKPGYNIWSSGKINNRTLFRKTDVKNLTPKERFFRVIGLKR